MKRLNRIMRRFASGLSAYAKEIVSGDQFEGIRLNFSGGSIRENVKYLKSQSSKSRS